ncbi:unannotated protein [freshwater metagenome]|uniref:Unannotated protein n=1 Tax=freshwater metagenome TaxID=449393 RepID=A0A6J6S9R6_9ZZZZ
MHVLVDRVIRGGTVANVGVRDEANVLKDFEGPIDSGEIDAGRCALDLDEDLLGGAVPKALDRLKNKLPLRRDAKPVLAQPAVPVDDHEPGALSSTRFKVAAR